MRIKTVSPDGKLNLVGKHLLEYRERTGLSQRQLAQLLQLNGLEWSHVQLLHVEKGERVVSDVELKIISDTLKIAVKKLLE